MTNKYKGDARHKASKYIIVIFGIVIILLAVIQAVKPVLFNEISNWIESYNAQ